MLSALRRWLGGMAVSSLSCALCVSGLRVGSSPFQIQREEFRENLLIAHLGVPAVGGEDGGVELLVGEGEPGRALVVEVRQGALLEALTLLLRRICAPIALTTRPRLRVTWCSQNLSVLIPKARS